MRRLLVLVAIVSTILATTSRPYESAATASWDVTSFDVSYVVDRDGNLEAVETINVDFGNLQKHGIFRYYDVAGPCSDPIQGAQQPLFACPKSSNRHWDYSNFSVKDATGKAWKYESLSEGLRRVIKIGDADKFITGKQTYVISYRVKGALDPYDDHDELYWDAVGEWPEADIKAFSLKLTLPNGARIETACYQGASGSSERCDSSANGSTATYLSTRTLNPYDQITIVAGWQKGVVDVPQPIVKDRVSPDDFFEGDWIEFGGSIAFLLLSIGGVVYLWWQNGRDKAYKSLYYLTNDPTEGTRPMFAKQQVVVEYLPPEDLRPAQMGIILDERADTLDVTATIIDLAVRGYLHITEIPKKGLFGSKDWKLNKVVRDDDLTEYERRLYDSLFQSGDEVEMSDLKDAFATRLGKVKEALYADAMSKKWFTQKPETSAIVWRLVAVGVMVLGVALAVLSGIVVGRALIPVPLVFGGLILLFMAGSMKRRTAAGSEALRRVLGFRLYIATAETRHQEFNEQENIFARYLPFAIVFGLVSKWAKAFEGLEDAAKQSTASWYTGVGAFQVAAFSSGLQGFSSSVGSTMSSTPSSSGGSGFSGGSSGGGGGGGGGGSW